MGRWWRTVVEDALFGAIEELADIATPQGSLRVLVSSKGDTPMLAICFAGGDVFQSGSSREPEAYARFGAEGLDRLIAMVREGKARLGDPSRDDPPLSTIRAMLDIPVRLVRGRVLADIGEAPSRGLHRLSLAVTERYGDRWLLISFRHSFNSWLVARLDGRDLDRLLDALERGADLLSKSDGLSVAAEPHFQDEIDEVGAVVPR